MPSRPRTQPQWTPRRGRAGPQLHGLPRPPALGGLWNSTFLRRVDGAGLCRWLNSSLTTTGWAGLRAGGAVGLRGRPAADSPPAQRGAKPLRRGWRARGSGRRGPGTHSHGISQLCTRLCAHTRARGHTRPARSGLVPGRGPAGRAVPPWAGQGRREGLGKPAPQSWGPAPLPAFRSAPPTLSGQPGSQAQEGSQEWPEGRACGLRPPAMA